MKLKIPEPSTIWNMFGENSTIVRTVDTWCIPGDNSKFNSNFLDFKHMNNSYSWISLSKFFNSCLDYNFKFIK